MNDINFDITKHWLPVGEKQGSIEKDTLKIKVSGINFHTKPEANFWGVYTGCIKPEQTIHMILMLLVSIRLMDNFWDMFKKSYKITLISLAKEKSWTV